MSGITGSLLVAIVAAVAFDFTNGFHDSSNAIAALVATRTARPGQAIVLAAVFNLAGPILAGTAVADTIGGIVVTAPDATLRVAGAALTGALVWNLVTWWLALPSSSSHALVGGLVGAAVVQGGWGAVHWGGFEGIRPVGVLGVLAMLAISPVLGFLVAFGATRLAQRALRRASRGIEAPIRASQWASAAALAFSHGANDAQKTMGVVTLLLVTTGHLQRFDVPLWVKLMAATSLTLGTSFGGWRIIRRVGSGIYRIRALDGLVSTGSSAAIILAAAAVGGPVSTTHVVASSVAGVGAGQRWRHVRWSIMGEIIAAWVVTIPAAGVLAILALMLWRRFT